MKKLHVKIDNQWLPVFCYVGGKIITCEKEPKKALPQRAIWAESDLRFFTNEFGDKEFSLMKI